MLNTSNTYVPVPSTSGLRVEAPETIFPLLVVQVYVKSDPEEEPVPSKTTTLELQSNIGAVAILATGAGTSSTIYEST